MQTKGMRYKVGLGIAGLGWLVVAPACVPEPDVDAVDAGAQALEQTSSEPLAFAETSSLLERSDVGPCSDAKMAEILAPATEDRSTVAVSCDLTLSPEDRITKRIIIRGAAASGTTIDCNGATIDGGPGTLNYKKTMIEIRSAPPSTNPAFNPWSPPADITIRDCIVRGRIHTISMPNVPYLKESSWDATHPIRARNNAPRDILIEDNWLIGVGRIPVYIGLGTTRLVLRDNQIGGTSNSTAIYVDAESSDNEIRNNNIYTKTTREVIAIDSSRRNLIVNNRLSSLDTGGIYLYRNCGEDGVSRHTTPSHNQIINNVFYYDEYEGSNPSVYLGSRNGDRSYCDDDNGSSYGSGVSNNDWARYNVVMQNQIYKRSVGEMIRTRDSKSYPNYVDYNETVTAEIPRSAGCYVAGGYDDFVLHGHFSDVVTNYRGAPVCTSYRRVCNDGDLFTMTGSSCDIDRIEFDCQVSGNNAGCSRTAYCPAGKRILAASAVCNLESGTVSDADLSSIDVNTMRVARTSDSVGAGSCWVGSNSLRIGYRYIDSVRGYSGVRVGCKEYDNNGGDCHIHGELYCR